MHDAVMEELRRRLTEVDQIDVSRYQFINMEQLRDAAGDDWPVMRARVFLATRSIIERRVAEDDLIIPCATGYLVIYKSIAEKLAEQSTARIKEEMERFFLGDGKLTELKVEAVAEQLSIAEFEAALAAADLDFVDAPPSPPEEAPEPASAPSPFEGLSFMPAWDARQEAAASYFATPRAPSPSEGGCPLGVVRPDKPEPRLAFDLSVLDAAFGALDQLLSQGTRCAVIAPAGFANLSMPRTRAQYVTALSKAPEALKALLWVRVEDAPVGPPRAVMVEMGRLLKAHTPNLFIDTTLDALNLTAQSETGAGWIGASFAAHRSAHRSDLDRFNAIARRSGTATYLTDADTPAQLDMALSSGVRLIAGRAIAAYDAPRAPFRLSRDALVKRAA